LELQSHHTKQTHKVKSIAHQTSKGSKDKETVTLGTGKPHKPTKEIYCIYKAPSKTAKVKKLFRLELAKAHTKQRHKGKSIALAKLQVKRQRFKKLFHLELQSHYQAKAQREIYCTPNRQSGKGLKAVSLGTTKPPHTPSKPTKEIYCICKAPSKAAKIKKLFRLELQSHTQSKQGKASKYKEAVTLFRFRCRLKLQTFKGTKGNLLHLQTGKATTKRQRFKSCFAWNCKPTTKQTHKENSILFFMSLYWKHSR